MTWYRHVEDTTMDVRCGGRAHRVRWSAGTLHLDDHADRDAEEVLTALGGEVPPCLAVLRLYADAVADGGFVGEWSGREVPDPARTAWLVTALERYRTEGVQEFLHGLPIRRLGRMGQALVELTPGLLDRAALTVAHGLMAGGRTADPYVAGHLDEAVRRRVRRAFGRSLAGSALPGGSAALTPLRCHVTDGSPRLAGRIAGRSGTIEIGVGRSWLVDVWGTGLAHLEGLLVLDADDRGGGVALTAVTWTGGPAGLRPDLQQRWARHDGHRWMVT